MSDQNQIQYVFQNSRDASVLKCASLAIGYGRPELAKNILSSANIDAARLTEMQMRATQIQGIENGTQKIRSGVSL